MALRVTYIVVAVLIAGCLGAIAMLVFDESAPEQEAPPKSVEAPSPTFPPVSNTAIKTDRLALPDFSPPAPAAASLSLATARYYLAVPVVRTAPVSTPRTRPTNVLLDDQQIASIKARLRLTSAQEKYWPPVESALREVVGVLYTSRRQSIPVGPDHDAVKRLLAAAGPFMKQLRDDQRDQIKSLMRIAGLGSSLPSE